jgi:hypothetical protein
VLHVDGAVERVRAEETTQHQEIMSDTRPTPETQAAIMASKGAWSFELREKMEKLERERDDLARWKDDARELFLEIRDDEVNAQDETDKFLRDHEPSELSKMREAIKEASDAIKLQIFVRGTRDDTLDVLAQMQAALTKLQPFIK